MEEFYSDQLAYDVQVENLCVAVATLRYLCGFKQKLSFASFFWPCRMELFTISEPFAPNTVDIVIDGCHNQQRYSTLI